MERNNVSDSIIVQTQNRNISWYLPILFKKLSENTKIPERKSEYAAGYDLFAAEDFTLAPQTSYAVATNLAVAIPVGYYGRVAPRSGLAFKNGIDVFGGVIDPDYRGDIKVILYNSKQFDSFKISKGDRIAQLVIEKYHDVSWRETNELPETERGKGGLGSTGTR